MAEGKKTFIFYSDWINMVRKMPNKDAGELLKHILSYVNDENPTTDNVLVDVVFGHMQPILKSDLLKWEKQLKRFSDMGKKSAENKKSQVQPKLTNVKPTLTVNDNVNVNDIQLLYNKFVEEVKSGGYDSRVEAMYMRLKLQKGSLTPLLKEFYLHLVEENRLHKNTNDLFINFKNWLNIQETKDKLKQYKL